MVNETIEHVGAAQVPSLGDLTQDGDVIDDKASTTEMLSFPLLTLCREISS